MVPPLSSPVLYYITPTQHAQFLDSIVQSDIDRFASSLMNSLAVSVRVDGAVDQTADHNVFVMANVVNRGASMQTVFLGFGIPEDEVEGAVAYCQCMQTVVN